MTAPNENNIRFIFSYKTPAAAKLAKFAALREAATNFGLAIDEHCPPSADQTAAMLQVQDALMTANRAVANDGVGYRPLGVLGGSGDSGSSRGGSKSPSGDPAKEPTAPAPDFDLVSEIKAGWLMSTQAVDVAKDLNDRANANVFAVSYRQKDGRYTLYQVNSQGIGGMGAGDTHVWSDARTFAPLAETTDRTEPKISEEDLARRTRSDRSD